MRRTNGACRPGAPPATSPPASSTTQNERVATELSTSNRAHGDGGSVTVPQADRAPNVRQ
jgi:hypothetical protein